MRGDIMERTSAAHGVDRRHFSFRNVKLNHPAEKGEEGPQDTLVGKGNGTYSRIDIVVHLGTLEEQKMEPGSNKFVLNPSL